jgi:cytochrome c peroxidase
LLAGTSLPAAQARFPVVVPEEMRGGLLPGADDIDIRQHLAARIGDFGTGRGAIEGNNWLEVFQRAFASDLSAEELVTFDNIALALAEYQRSMSFVDTAWNAYVRGDAAAIGNTAKLGALLFYLGTEDGGFDCVRCHGGDFFTDERHTVAAFPQIGPGKLDGGMQDADYGREQQTDDPAHRFAFRTPTLLNIQVTAPYSHAGAYETLAETVLRYILPEPVFASFMRRGGICALGQFGHRPDCAALFPNVAVNTELALARVAELRLAESDLSFPDISDSPVSDAIPFGAFLQTLTDPCVLDYQCLKPWIPDAEEAPDAHQLNATDRDGNRLSIRPESLTPFGDPTAVEALLRDLAVVIPPDAFSASEN